MKAIHKGAQEEHHLPTRQVYVCEVLPYPARKALIDAALAEPQAPIAESRYRASLLDRTIERIKLAYPQFFQKGGHTNYT